MTEITCPNCSHVFAIEDVLTENMEERIKKKYEDRLNKSLEGLKAERRSIEAEKEKLQALVADQQAAVQEEVRRRLEAERRRIEKQTEEEFAERMKVLEEENARRRAEARSFRKKEAELLRRESAMREKEEELELQMEKRFLEKQRAIEQKARERERQNFELEKADLLKKLDDAKKSAEEMKRKVEQGSMQLQGEVQELAIENLLGSTYAHDRIEEVPKGMRGADCIQTVVNSQLRECGTIVYESKRTKAFSKGWIAKLKKDQLSCKADIAVLVTQAMPADMERFGLRDGVWICGYHELKSLSFVLREMLIKMHSVKSSEENKGEKMALLYNYLTSEEFALHIKNLVEGYDAMLKQLNDEKRAMQRIWKKREQQILGVQGNVASLFGSIEGIAGKAIKGVDVLQLPG